MDQHEDCISPPSGPKRDEAMEEDFNTPQNRGRRTSHPAAQDCNRHIDKGTTSEERPICPSACTKRVLPYTLIYHTRQGAKRNRCGRHINNFASQCAFAPLEPIGSRSKGRDNDILSFGSFSGANCAGSGSSGSREHEPTPLTPDILLLPDRLEPNTGKRARITTTHITGQ